MAILFDCHLHTDFSGDCDTPLDDQIAAAKALGLKGITVTDHLDWDFFVSPGYFDLDLECYQRTLDAYRLRYPMGSDFSVLKGLELGMQEHLADRHKALLDKYDFDYVIGSIHQLDGLDPYYPDYYAGRDAGQIYRRTFETTLENLNAFHNIDSLGHLDYMRRYIIREYGPQKGAYRYTDFPEMIDSILEFLIRHDIALEVNEGAFRCNLTEPNPQYDVISRYFNLGGRLITIGADAHYTRHVGLHFDDVCLRLKEIGFREYAVYQDRRPILFAL